MTRDGVSRSENITTVRKHGKCLSKQSAETVHLIDVSQRKTDNR